MRKVFFGKDGDASWNQIEHPRYKFYDLDIRDSRRVIKKCKPDLIIHAAAQPSHDWASTNPILDFGVNAKGTLELLEALRHLCPKAVFIYVSTNKVYGDLGDIELAVQNEAWLPTEPALRTRGVDERRPLDFHTPYGCSKGAADQYVLDYARSYDVPTCVLRMSCIYGPRQMGTEDQGWVAHFLIRALEGAPITLYGDGLMQWANRQEDT
jgi:CDP-paratose 2-epimerase